MQPHYPAGNATASTLPGRRQPTQPPAGECHRRRTAGGRTSPLLGTGRPRRRTGLWRTTTARTSPRSPSPSPRSLMIPIDPSTSLHAGGRERWVGKAATKCAAEGGAESREACGIGGSGHCRGLARRPKSLFATPFTPSADSHPPTSKPSLGTPLLPLHLRHKLPTPSLSCRYCTEENSLFCFCK